MSGRRKKRDYSLIGKTEKEGSKEKTGKEGKEGRNRGAEIARKSKEENERNKREGGYKNDNGIKSASLRKIFIKVMI